jgi:hypothetical protein
MSRQANEKEGRGVTLRLDIVHLGVSLGLTLRLDQLEFKRVRVARRMARRFVIRI